jgi:hypothetical protein
MKFKKWIKDQGGPRAIARLLETESPTVYAWLSGAATPNALTMQKLVKLGRGAFDYDDIINDTKRKSRTTQGRGSL